MAFKSVLVILVSALVSVNALATPHAFSNNHHRAIAARVAAPVPLPEVPLAHEAPVRRSRRSISRRCKARPAPVASSSSQAPATSVAPVNVAPDPSTVVAQTTSSAARETTSSAAPETTPQTTHEPATTKEHTSSSPAPAPTTTSNSDSGSSNSGSQSGSGSDSSNNSGLSFLTGTQTGQGTFYSTGLGACGITNTDTDHIAAVSHLLFDAFPGYNGVNPNNNPVCGKRITATYQGKSTTITVTDRCEGCALTDLDFSPTAFSDLADFAVGRLSGMTWVWD